MAALVKAIEQKRFKQVEILMRLGDNVNQQEEKSGTTPLLAVCFLEDENLACRIAKKLLHRGADVSLQDEDGMSPLMQASRLGKEKLVQAFIESEECDFAAVDSNGNTALIHSIEVGNSRIAKALTKAMNIYDVRAADKPNKNGETPLIRATKLQRNDCKEVLLSDGKASPCARDFDLKLNAREWELHLNKKEENNKVKLKVIKNRNVLSRASDRNQNGDYYESSKVKSSIIKCKQDFPNTACPLKHSVSFIVNNKVDDKVHRGRTKSAPLVKGENSAPLANSETVHLQTRNKEICTDKWAISAKGKSCLPRMCLQMQENSKQLSVSMVPTTGFLNEHEKQFKVELNGELVRKEGLPAPSAGSIEHKMSKNQTNGNSEQKTSINYQSQLPQLFSLMTDQKSHSFRSSAKERIHREPPSGKRKPSAGKDSGKRLSPRRGSMTMQGLSTGHARRRWSTAMAAMDTLGRFSSLYSRSDFQALNPESLAAAFDKPVLRLRRGSLRLSPDVVGSTAYMKETKISVISPNLVKLNPGLSHSLPDRSNFSRIKSSKPRPRLYTRHNSDSSILTGNSSGRLSEVLSKTPVIEETEEGAASDS